jgi:outer membrane protein
MGAGFEVIFRRDMMKKRFATTLLAAMIATSAHAYTAGDMILRAGAAGVLPTGDGTIVSGGTVEADDAWSLGITFTYMATDNLGVGVLAAWPFDHDIKAKGALAGLGKIADTKQLPPTVTLQYHFDNGSKVHPFVGVGVNYTNFFDTNETSSMDGDSLDLDDSWGLAAEAGIDFELNNNWMVSGQVWYLDIDTDATISGDNLGVDGTYNVSIDPWVVMLSVGKKF